MAHRTRSDSAAALTSPASPSQVRNIVLVGRSGAGKTTLVEHLLHATGAIPRVGRVEDGTTASDSTDVEARLGHSVQLSLQCLEHHGVRLNLLDTPGHPDFVGEVRAGLRAADAALFVVSAVDGVDPVTSELWRECEDAGLPRAVALTRVDSPRADVDAMVEIFQRVLGEGVTPLYLPVHGGSPEQPEGVSGLLGLLSGTLADYSGRERVERPADTEHLAPLREAREPLLEAIIAGSEDETLLERYVGGEELDADMLAKDLETAVARGWFHPVVPFSSVSGVGTAELLELLSGGFPSPLEHPLPVVTTPDGEPHDAVRCAATDPLVAEVVRTSSDPYVGRLSWVRVFSGTLRPDMVLHVSGHGGVQRQRPDHDDDEPVGTVCAPVGRDLVLLDAARAGDVVVVTRLLHAETGDTLSDPSDPVLVEPWELPEPLLPVAVTARTTSDEDRLGAALARVVAEDPTLRVEHRAGQLVLWCVGDTQAEVALERLAGNHGAEVDRVELRLAHRRTFTAAVPGHGRLVKQSGGHGQYAVVDVLVEPLPPGSGIEFADKVVGGAVPRAYISSVEKGVRAQLDAGLGDDVPVIDVRVTLLDGKSHSVDSSDQAFAHAGGLAVRHAAESGATILLEPLVEVSVSVPSTAVGPVLSDLSARHGKVTRSDTDADREGATVVTAEVPESQVLRYAVELRALTHGAGRFRRRDLGHQPVQA